MFLGWVVVCILDECIAISLGELAAKYPTSAGPYYWSHQIADPRYKTILSFITGWTWLIGNWTITLSVNFGFASLLAATVNIYEPNYEWQPWKLVLLCYGLCVVTWIIVAFGNRLLPSVDTVCAAFTAITILVACIWLSVEAKQGRHSAAYTLVHLLTASKLYILTVICRATKILPYLAGAVSRSSSAFCLQLIRRHHVQPSSTPSGLGANTEPDSLLSV